MNITAYCPGWLTATIDGRTYFARSATEIALLAFTASSEYSKDHRRPHSSREKPDHDQLPEKALRSL